MRKVYFGILLLAPIIFSNCSSGKKAYEQGDYYSAVVKAVNRLRQNPDHKKSRATLESSYPLAISTIERDIENLLNSNTPFKYRESLRYYDQINKLYEEIRRAPGALRVIPRPKEYYAKVSVVKEQAAEESYAAAMTALNRDTREDAKQAFLLLRDVQNYVPGYKDVLDKMDEAQFKATLKVVIDQIPVVSRFTLSANFFQDKVEEYLHTQFRSNQFVRFYTPREVEETDLPYVDQYLRLQFDDFVVGETHTLRTTETFTKDSVKVGTVTLEDGKKVDAFNTVSAKLTVFRKEVISKGRLSMQVFDAKSNAVLSARKIDGEFVWFSQWGSFNGDERALTNDQINITKQVEVPPPPPQDLFIEFTVPIYNQLVPAINGFYRRF